MTRLRCTPANEVAPAKAIELRQQIRLLCEPVFIFRNDIRATSVSADQERIAPYGRPTDVDRIGGRPAELFLVQHLWVVFAASLGSFCRETAGVGGGTRRPPPVGQAARFRVAVRAAMIRSDAQA